MANKNKKSQKQPDQQPTAQPVELSEEELEQVGGGSMQWGANETPASTGVGGLPTMNVN